MSEPSSFRDSGAQRFEVSSRGDLVPGLLWCGGARRALVVIAPAPGLGKAAPSVAALGSALAGRGLAAAALDLPLQGERASAKLSARIARCAEHGPASPTDHLLWEEFVRQAAHDLTAALDALRRRGELARLPVACAAHPRASAAAEAWARDDERVRAVLEVDPAGEASLAAARIAAALERLDSP